MLGKLVETANLSIDVDIRVKWMETTEVAKGAAASTLIPTAKTSSKAVKRKRDQKAEDKMSAALSPTPSPTVVKKPILRKDDKRTEEEKAQDKRLTKSKKTERKARPWTKEETRLYIEAVELYGKNHRKIYEHLQTDRDFTSVQVYSVNLYR